VRRRHTPATSGISSAAISTPAATACRPKRRIDRVIRGWYASLARRQWLPPGDAERKCDDLLTARERPDLKPLARNPLLLTLIDSWDKAEIVVDYIEKRAGLLLGQGERHGERQFAFPHCSFQEFLAACHLANRPEFAAGWSCALLAGMQLLEIGIGAIRSRDRTRAIANRVAGWLAASLPVPPADGGVAARQRAFAGDVLARLGDPRRHLLEVDAMRFAQVPAGAFWMGDQDSGDAPLHCNETLDYDYWIAEAPVSVAQFAGFVSASGYADHDAAALRPPANRPVVSVSWHDARAFCAWLNERWRERLPAGWIVSLPSEAEWEKAARGGLQIPRAIRLAGIAQGFAASDARLQDNPLPQRSYPWGDDREAEKANAEMGIGDTSTAGVFAGGRSPYGCEDLAGNVWEWTRSLWGTDWGKPDFGYPYDANDRLREDPDASDEVLRVVRGGSWRNHRDHARCGIRGCPPPDLRDGLLGFRVVLRSSPVLPL